MNKKNDFSQKMHSYLRHPASLIMMILVKLAALITFTGMVAHTCNPSTSV